MGKKASKMYDKEKAPSLARDDKGGVTVKEGKKPSQEQKDADEVEAGTEGVLAEDHKIHDRREMFNRHITERMAMYHKHEMDSGGEDIAVRHAAERKDMHAKHESEHKALVKRHGKDSMAAETQKEPNDKDRKEKKSAKTDDAGEKA